ncbi:MAG: hypothetical protein JWN29_2823 [Acidimicrobiales bacterium]|nr:hypothetical protein [Acidimicrobiales bacterium]
MKPKWKYLTGFAAVIALACLASIAWAFWTSGGSGSAGAAAGDLAVPTGVTATSNGGSVTVDWTDAAASDGGDVDGYYIERLSGATSSPACDSGPAMEDLIPAINDPSCTDTNVADGTYTYRVTSVWRTWTATSAPSGSVTVTNDSAAPDAAITFPANNQQYNASAYAAGCSTPGGDICGTATDGSGVAEVRVSIESQTTNTYWDGSAFTLATETFNAASVTPVNGTAVGWNYELSTPGTGGYTIHVQAKDAGGHEQTGASYAAAASFTVDATAPTVTINQASLQADPTNVGPVHFTATFSEPVMGFTATDVTLGGTGVASATVTVTGSGADYDVAVAGMTDNGTSGTVIAWIPAGGANDLADNPNAESTSADATITYDATTPGVTVNQAPGQPDPTNGTINFTVQFTEPVTGFVGADVTLTGTAGNLGSATKTFTGSGDTFNLAVSGLTGSGSVSASVPAGGAQDAAMNVNTASTSIDNTVTYDVTPPTVTIDQAAGQVDPTNGTVNFTVVFSEPVTGFTDADVSLSGTSGNVGSATKTVTGTGPMFSVAVTGLTGSGSVTASVPAGGVQDAATNVNTASTSTDNTVSYDVTPPTVTINQAAGQADPTNVATAGSPINFTIVFSEPVTGVAASDVTLSGTAGGLASATKALSGSGSAYNLAVSGLTGSGTVTATVGATVAQDTAGNDSAASTSTDNSVTYDVTPPTVTINQATAQADPTNVGPFNFTVVFSETTTSFTNADVTVNKGATTGTPSVAVTGSGATYNVAVSGLSGNGAVSASVVSGAISDAAGNPSQGSTGTDNSVTLDTNAPTVSGVALTNGGATAGRVESGDAIVVSFSERMGVNGLCSAWSNDAANQSLNSNGDNVSVALNDGGAGNDTITVTSTACSFNLGTLNLGSAAYTTTTRTFGGNGSSRSMVNWNATTFQLTIVLGNGTAGTGTVASSTPTFTVPAAAKDAAGNNVSNSPFTLPAGQKF